jgi:ESS family glutamate:Na+ symporter
MFDLSNALFAYIVVGILILLGRYVRQRIGWLQALYLPSSIVAGILALLLGPDVLGAIARAIAGTDTPLANGLFPDTMRAVWGQSPSVFINVVFAALFMGAAIPNPRDIWRKAAPQVAFGQSLAWGQYVVGLLLVLLVLNPVFGIDPIAGALIEIGFEGGHGTAAGMAGTFAELDFPAGSDLALGLATIGIISGIIAGTLLADWGRRQGHVSPKMYRDADEAPSADVSSSEPRDIREERARLMQDLLVDPLSLNLGLVGLAIAIGWLLLQLFIWIESVSWGQSGFQVFTYVPLFPMALIGGIIVQLTLLRLRLGALVVRSLMANIAGVALDVTVVTALATISLKVLGSNFFPFVILAVAGITWNVLAFVFLAPRLLPTYWFERGLGDVGQSMGVTATGILLLRMVDPHNRSGAFESFAYKQLFFEPIVGGGLFTAAAPALIFQFGAVRILILAAAILAGWLIFGFVNFRKSGTSREV